MGLVCAALAYGDNSKADSLSSTYGDELVEAGHRAKVALDGRVAVVTVTRKLENRGKYADEARLTINLPAESAVVGLRARSRGKWIAGTLQNAETAQRQYDRLTRDGPVRSDGPALMAYNDTANVELTVFPVRKGSARVVEYTVRASTCYSNGLRLFGYPRSDAATGAIDVIAVKGRVYQSLVKAPLEVKDSVDSCVADRGSSPDSFVWAVFDARQKEQLGTAFASFDTGADQRLTRLEVDVSAELSKAPKRAKVVFVVDASHTQGPDGITAQLELAKAYLEHVPDASFEVVLYRRYAERLLGRFAPAKDAASVLAGVPRSALDPNNGSNLDDGLGLAASLLSGTRGPARVVAFTDSRLRVGFDNSVAAAMFAAAPEQVVLHIVDNPLTLGADQEFGRFDGHELSSIAEQFGGIVISPNAEMMWNDVETSMLALVRPLQIDSVAIAGLEIPNAPALLREGEAVRHMEVMPSANAPRSVTLSGKLWARDVSKTIRIDRALTAEMPAMVFGTEHWRELNPESIESVAMAGNAVSPKTSYLAVNPDLGPSSTDFKGGLSMSGICGGCSIGCGSRCGIRGIGHIGRAVEEIDLNALLAGWMEPATAVCQAMHSTRNHSTTVNFEIHSREIADVAVETSASDEFAECIEDAAWDIQLDSRFWRTFDRRIVSL